jgi:hypothetical protein
MVELPTMMDATCFFFEPSTIISWSFLGPGAEVGLMPNFMKGIHVFPFQLLGHFFLFSTK